MHEPVQSNLRIHKTGDLGVHHRPSVHMDRLQSGLGVHQRPSVHMDRLQSGLGSFCFGFTVQDVGLERVSEVA